MGVQLKKQVNALILILHCLCIGINAADRADKDSLYLLQFQQKAVQWQDNNLDSSNYWAYRLIQEARRLKSNRYLANAHNQLGTNYSRAGEQDSALLNLNKAMLYAELGAFRNLEAAIIYNRSMVFRALNKLDQATADLKAVMRLDLKAGNYRMIAGTLNEIGNCLIANDKTAEGIQQYMQALKMAEFYKDTLLCGGISVNLSAEFINLKLFKDAEYYAKKAEYWFLLANNSRGLSYAYNRLALVNKHFKKSVEHHSLLQKALVLGIETDDVSHIATVYEGLGIYYYEINQNDSAFIYHTKALKLRRLNEEVKLLSSSYFNLATLFFRQSNFKKSAIYLDSLFALPNQGNTELLYLGHKLNSQIDSVGGNYGQAYFHAQKALYYYELYFNDETKTEAVRAKINLDKQASELEFKNEILRKEIEINKQVEAQRQFRLMTFLFFSLLIVLFIIIYLIRIRKQQQREFELRLKLYESEMDGLNAQINTHFIYNTLSVIQRFIYDNVADKALDTLHKFALLLRSSLKHSRKRCISIASEIESLKVFIDLELLNYNNTPAILYEIDKQLITCEDQIPPMLIQPLVENAFKHGISKNPDAGKLIIQFIRQNERLTIRIYDNGPSLDKEITEAGLSTSSSILNDRLALLNRRYKTDEFKSHLRIETIDSVSFTCAEITIPIIN